MLPERWPAYVQRMTVLLKPGGRLIGIFPYGEEPEPPPLPLTNETASALFGSSFVLVVSDPIPAEQILAALRRPGSGGKSGRESNGMMRAPPANHANRRKSRGSDSR